MVQEHRGGQVITTRQLWNVLPHVARFALIPENLYTDYRALDSTIWTPERVTASPWYIPPPEVKEAIHGMVACTEMEGEG